MGKLNEIHLRVSDENRKHINALAEALSISKNGAVNFALTCFFNDKDVEKIILKDASFRKSVIYEMRRYGNNLNQVAYQLNKVTKETKDTFPNVANYALKQLDILISEMKSLTDLINKRL